MEAGHGLQRKRCRRSLCGMELHGSAQPLETSGTERALAEIECKENLEPITVILFLGHMDLTLVLKKTNRY
ncbi:hypothetical protein AV530_005213 [Patagioenas fasciata monilis]|uniref:Uncharacterized protein n=1 Tax=Patagioenas fasciata monilis TaxID=372326 RepID=A0A1V4JKG2_PATFA|nr:hypothetical protein AV530_005213 [Patagioenas fasciata monilis]